MDTNNKNKRFTIPEFPLKVLIGIKDGYCNMNCPICFMHSKDSAEGINVLRGEMPMEKLREILCEIKEAKPLITPNRWSEPLLIDNFREAMLAIKEHGLSIVINTNGLLLDRSLAEFFIEIKLDSITFSIDAVEEETFKKMRGIKALDKLKKAVFLMLETRGGSELPRIGVSFVAGQENRHEKDRFVNYWLQYVDLVRVNKLYNSDFKVKDLDLPDDRVPCHMIYESMMIDYKGDVNICCLDALGKTNMGNVFKEGVKKVWHGEKFSRLRYCHEISQYDKLPLCKGCSQWVNYQIKESVAGNILIRESPLVTFYNRIDRLNTWKTNEAYNTMMERTLS